MPGKLGEARDLALALDSGRVVGGKARDQALEPVSDLKREVRYRGAGESAHVLDRDPAASE
jgi:hypothetical protein